MSLAEDLSLLVAEAELGADAAAIARVAAVRPADAPPVVAVAGGTGSGKSSLVNALAGAEVTEVGELRPTTSEVFAVMPAEGNGSTLLDHLGVLERHAGAQGAFVLLDLPDLDSIVGGHRDLAEAAIAAADAVVWVVDPEKYADAVVHEVMARFEAVPSVVALGHADRLSGPDRLEILDDLRSMVGERPVLAVAVPKDAPPTGLEELGSVLAEVEASPVDNATLAVVQRAAEAVGRDPEPLPSEAWAAAEESAVGGMDGQVASTRERLERAGRRQALMGRFDAELAASIAQPPRPPQTWDPALPVVSAALEYWEAAAAELSGGVEHAQLLLGRAAVRSRSWWLWVRWGGLVLSAVLIGLAVVTFVLPDQLPVPWWALLPAALVVLVAVWIALARSGAAAGSQAAEVAAADARRLVAGARSGTVVEAQKERCAELGELISAKGRILSQSGLGPMP